MLCRKAASFRVLLFQDRNIFPVLLFLKQRFYNHMKPTLPLFKSVFPTFLAGLFWLSFSCQHNHSAPSGMRQSLMLRSSGQVETTPDMASFSLNLRCLDKSVSTAKECLVKQSNELKSRLLALGIEEKDLLTTSVDLSKSYGWKNNSQVFEGYAASTSLTVTVRKLDELDKIYSELLENRNLDLYGLAYSHSKIDSLQNEAYAQALKKAGVLADRLVKEMGKTKKEFVKVGNVAFASSPMPSAEAKMMDANELSLGGNAQQPIAIGKGTVVVAAELQVEFGVE